MTDLLLRLFVKHASDTSDPAVRAGYGRLAGVTGIVCNLLLFALKLLAGTISGSVSITADAVNNLSDASGSIVTLVGFKLASRPADDEHPYGHARMEYLSGLAVAVLILVIGVELVKTSAEKILHPTAVEFSAIAAVVLLASIGVKLWMNLFNRALSKKIDSKALLATAEDSRNDCITTTAVLLAALFERQFHIPVDGWVGLAVAAFILHSGWGLAKDTISPLLGENADPELREKLVDYIVSQPKVLGYHDLMVHDYGPGQRFASIHVEMDCREDPLECHEIIDDMERECLRSHNVHLVIHYDPVVVDDPELNRLRKRVLCLLQSRDPRLTLHDFRMIRGKRHINLVFDVVIPLSLEPKEEEICRFLEDTLNAEGEVTYHVVATFDTAEFN